jgi:hypothetical protein
LVGLPPDAVRKSSASLQRGEFPDKVAPTRRAAIAGAPRSDCCSRHSRVLRAADADLTRRAVPSSGIAVTDKD